MPGSRVRKAHFGEGNYHFPPALNPGFGTSISNPALVLQRGGAGGARRGRRRSEKAGWGVDFLSYHFFCDHGKLLYDYAKVSQQSGNNLPRINGGGNRGGDLGAKPCVRRLFHVCR